MTWLVNIAIATGFTDLEGMESLEAFATQHLVAATDLLDLFDESPSSMPCEEAEKRVQVGEPSPSLKNP